MFRFICSLDGIYHKQQTHLVVAHRFLTLLAIVWFIFSTVPSLADSTYLPKSATEASSYTNELQLYVSNGELVILREPAAHVFVADPTIADIQLPTRDRMFVYGKKPGRTTIFALRADGSKSETHSVRVTHNNTDLERFLKSELGDIPVEIMETPQGVLLTGVVANAETAERVRAVATRLAGEGNPIVNNLRVSGSMQVFIRVRIAEVSRSVIKELGINWNAVASAGSFNFGLATGREILSSAAQAAGLPGITRGGKSNVLASYSGKRASITALIDALATQGLVSILAEPTLTAGSGEKASFLAGGEFPIPVAQGQNGNISVDYRKYGVALEFTPIVLSDRLVNLYVKPEVSELSIEGAITLSNFQIPAITTRRSETTVQLGSGESLVIAGLVQNRFSTEIEKMPGIGDLPVLGALFRSSRFRRNESELIIVVTPYIVRPIANPQAVTLPTDLVEAPTDLERILKGRLARRPNEPSPDGLRIKGDPGFLFK